jgi:hypothetical protein
MASRQKDPGIANRSVAPPVTGQLPLANFTPSSVADAVLTSNAGTPAWDNTPQIQTYYFSGRITPANISANQNDYNPIDGVSSQSFHEVMQISVSATGAFDITGFDVGTTGEPKVFTNRGTSTITLKHNDSNSSVNNRIWCPNATDFAVQGKTSVQLYYSQPDNKWVVVGGTQGSGGGNALLDGSVHTDTVAQTVSRGSLIYGNSTPKWDELTVGGASTVLTSDGTDVSWQSISIVGGNLFLQTTNLSNAQTLALGTTPQTVATAAGAGKVLVPISVEVLKDSAAGAYTGTPTMRFRHTGDTIDLFPTLAFSSGANIQTGLVGGAGGGIGLVRTTSTFDNRNKDIQASFAADLTGGNAANTTKIRFLYAIADFN